MERLAANQNCVVCQVVASKRVRDSKKDSVELLPLTRRQLTIGHATCVSG